MKDEIIDWNEKESRGNNESRTKARSENLGISTLAVHNLTLLQEQDQFRFTRLQHTYSRTPSMQPTFSDSGQKEIFIPAL